MNKSTILNLFMQSKPNFQNTQMNINNVLTTNYIKWTPGECGKKQSQNKAKQSQSQKSQNELKFIFNKALRKKNDDFRLMKTKPKQTQFKPNFLKGNISQRASHNRAGFEILSKIVKCLSNSCLHSVRKLLGLKYVSRPNDKRKTRTSKPYPR